MRLKMSNKKIGWLGQRSFYGALGLGTRRRVLRFDRLLGSTYTPAIQDREDDQVNARGRAGDGTTRGHAGDGTTRGRAGDGTARGRAGDGTTRGRAGDGTTRGRAGDGTARGRAGDGTTRGRAGDGTTRGRAGDGTARGRAGDGTARGRAGDGTARGRAGDGTARGRAGDGTARGRAGDGTAQDDQRDGAASHMSFISRTQLYTFLLVSLGGLAWVSDAYAQSNDETVSAVSSDEEFDDKSAKEGETEVQSVANIDRSTSFGDINAAGVPTEKKKERVESMLVDQRSALGRVVTILAEARSSKDIVQLNCVNEKLIQVKGLLKISEQASLEMYESIANGAQDLVNHEYTKVVVAHQKGQVLKAEAELCVGESSVYAGDTNVNVEIDAEADGFGGDPSLAAAPPPGPALPPVSSIF